MYESELTGIVAIYVVALLLNFVSLIACPVIASRKNRSVGGWIVGALLIGTLALIIIACLPDLTPRRHYYAPNPHQPFYGTSSPSSTPTAPLQSVINKNETAKAPVTPSIPTDAKPCASCGKTIASSVCPFCGAQNQ